MKVVIQIKEKNQGKRMLEFANLCVTKTEYSYSGSGNTYGYSAVIKYPDSEEIYYDKRFTSYQYPGKYNPVDVANEECNKYIDEIIQKIQTAVTNAKKRHEEFTEVIELD